MPIYDLTYKGKTYSIESESPLSEQEIDTIFKNDIEGKELPESQPTEIPLNESEAPKGTPADVGLAQSAVLGATFGTAPLIAGGINVLKKLPRQELAAILPESLEKYADRFLGKRENLGEAFKKGKSDFLESQQQYAKQAPTAAMLAEVAGGFALPIGSLGGVAKGLSVLDKIKKGAKAGAFLGGAYGAGTGLSQTKDKVLDIEEGLKGGLFGAGVGTLGGVLGSAIPQGIKKLITSKDIGRKLDYIVPSGTQKKTIENIIENPKVQKEAVKKGFNMNYDIYLNDASKRIENLTDDVNKIIKDAYKDIPDTTKIDLTKTNAFGKMKTAFNEYLNLSGTKLLPKNEVIKETQEILNNLQKQLVKNNSNINFGSLKETTDFLNSQAEKFARDGDYTTAKMYNKMRSALAEARDQIPKIAKATELYHNTKTAKEILEKSLGVKLDNPKNASSAILSNFRDNKGSYVTEQVEEAVNILKNHPETKHLADITDKIKLAQTSYDLRPKEESKLLSALASKGKSLIQELTGTSPAEKARNLARRLSSGQITKEQLAEPFNLVGSPLFEESINKLIQGQKAYGGKLSTAGKGIEKIKLGTYTLPRITIKQLLKEKE